MTQLVDWYRQGLAARIEALESAKKQLDGEKREALESIQRIAHSLRGSGATYGFQEITDAAEVVEEADGDDLLPCLDRLLEVLRRAASQGDTEGAGILVVDDDPEIREILQLKLSAPTRRIFTAETTEEAERILEEESVSLILLDLILPDSDGRNFLMRLRERPRTAAIPVFVVSGQVGTQPETECFALGADEYFTKPINLDILSAAVARRLQRSIEVSRESRLDSLTEIANRAAFREAFERAAAHVARTHEPLSIAILDLDRFKSINDTYGHGVGDQVLRRAASVISNALRKSDFLARWGGEEFVVFFPNTDSQKAVVAVENALQALRSESFAAEDQTRFQVTFSAGVVDVSEGTPLEEAVAAADRFLYHAKDSGRNQVLSPSTHAPSTKKRVLLAEDDELIASLIVHRLGHEEFEVFHCPDGRAALSKAQETDFSLVILDVKMPGMDGFELLEHLRNMPAYQAVPIMMLTAMGKETDIVRGLDLGANDYMLKPFSPVELLARIRRLIRKR